MSEQGTRIFCDGLCFPNPGMGCYGLVVETQGSTWYEAGLVGSGLTNNRAEYHALIRAIAVARTLPPPVTIYTDSLLCVNQVNGVYAVSSSVLLKLWRQAVAAMTKDTRVEWIPRAKNRRADALSTIAYAYFVAPEMFNAALSLPVAREGRKKVVVIEGENSYGVGLSSWRCDCGFSFNGRRLCKHSIAARLYLVGKKELRICDSDNTVVWSNR